MCFIQIDIPQSLCEIDHGLKAIYHSKDTVCIWVFNNRDERNDFMEETVGMLKAERESHYEKYYNLKVTKQLETYIILHKINYLQKQF